MTLSYTKARWQIPFDQSWHVCIARTHPTVTVTSGPTDICSNLSGGCR